MEFVYIILHLRMHAYIHAYMHSVVHIYLYTWPLLLSVWPSFLCPTYGGPIWVPLVFHDGNLESTFQKVEAYGSEKGDLSVDDITNVLKIHGKRMVCFWQGLQKHVLNALGVGGVTWCCWFLLFVRKNDFDMCLCLKIFSLWFGGTHSTWDS